MAIFQWQGREGILRKAGAKVDWIKVQVNTELIIVKAAQLF